MSDGETSGGMEARVVAGAWADPGVICAFGTACAEPCVFARLVERLRAQERLAVGRVDGRSGALCGPASFGPIALGCRKVGRPDTQLCSGRTAQYGGGTHRRRDGFCKEGPALGGCQAPI